MDIEIKIQSFGNDAKNIFDKSDLSIVVDKYDFKNEETLAANIFQKLSHKWALKYNFDPAILKENEAFLINELSQDFRGKPLTLIGKKNCQ